MKNYRFYGWENAKATPLHEKYKIISSPQLLYDILSEIWCSETCAPRLRDNWSINNKTLGQCSVTAFLVQDIFGGKVYGIPLENGSVHCYNVVGDSVFDLTSEQFDNEGIKLDYKNNYEQNRETHFIKSEKRERYEYLKKELESRLFMPGDKIKHFKRETVPEQSNRYLYEIVGIAHNSEDILSLVMVYRQLYAPFDLYVRPLSMFLSKVDKIKYPAIKQKYRFEKL